MYNSLQGWEKKLQRPNAVYKITCKDPLTQCCEAGARGGAGGGDII